MHGNYFGNYVLLEGRKRKKKEEGTLIVTGQRRREEKALERQLSDFECD